MSDAYYQARARRRARLVLALVIISLTVLLVVLAIRALFYDACTRSLERSPRSIVSTFMEAVGRGDLPVAQECWEHEAFYELEAGCSEICISRVSGSQFRVLDITLGEPQTKADGHAHMAVTVSIACAQGDETHSAEILLDSSRPGVPWRHWAIIRSTFGGTVAEPWCK